MNLRKIMINVIISVIIGFVIINIVGAFFADQGMISAIKAFPKKAWLVLLGLLALDYLLHTFRMFFVVRSLGYKLTFFQCFENVFLNIFFSFVTPMSIGGQPFQIYHLTRLGIPAYEATSISISRMFVGIAIVFTVDIFLIGKVLSILRGTVGLTLVLIGFFVTVVITILGFLVFVNKKALLNIFRFVGFITRSEKMKKKEIAALEWLDKMSQSTKMLFSKSSWSLILDFCLGILGSALISYQLKFAIESVSTKSLAFPVFWGIMTMLNTVVYYIPTPGSSGGVEGFYQLVYSTIYGGKASMSGIIVYRFVTYYLIVFLGTALVWRFARFRKEIEAVEPSEGTSELTEPTEESTKEHVDDHK
ncbi:MAG TPA: lysylphosphatidylglycerol synthase transmembrane domain-containing protein [Fervidobacterium sp.]|nr:lysylphosphatidylglycerol synthase transmembrane domain-containing protein [Fervidobacterium sp.]HQQ17771.1 lysylphosphatidylglycerol synthase transmembrane domain-containing protein [Fervidobacterium sp.]